MRTIELTAFAVRDETGAVRYFVGAKRDVTLRKLRESALQRRYEQLHAIYRMTAAVSRATALTAIYEAALTCLEDAIGADRTAILLLDDDGVMRFKAWHGLSDGYRAAVEGHPPGPTDPNPQPITIADVAAVPELAELRPASSPITAWSSSRSRATTGMCGLWYPTPAAASRPSITAASSNPSGR